jgi:transcriptional regulator with XRE-family HTH domain
MITGAQVKAARFLLGWSIEDLASRSGVGRGLIARLEKEERRPADEFVRQIENALVRGGVELSDDNTVLDPKRATWDLPLKMRTYKR